MAEPFRRKRLVTVISRHHRLARAQSISLHDLERTPFLIRASGTSDSTTATRLKYLGHENGINITIGMRFESPLAIKEAIHRNLGIGIVYEDVVRYDVRHGDFKIIDIPWLRLQRQSYIIYLNDKPLSKTATDFLGLLRRSKFEKGINQNHLSEQRTPPILRTSVPQLRGERRSKGFSV